MLKIMLALFLNYVHLMLIYFYNLLKMKEKLICHWSKPLTTILKPLGLLVKMRDSKAWKFPKSKKWWEQLLTPNGLTKLKNFNLLLWDKVCLKLLMLEPTGPNAPPSLDILEINLTVGHVGHMEQPKHLMIEIVSKLGIPHYSVLLILLVVVDFCPV